MAQVRGHDDLAGRGVRSGDRRDHDVVGRQDHLRRDARAQDDLLAGGKARAQVLRLSLRDHEGKPVLELVGRQVPPADQVAVVARPRRRLVRIRREETGRATLLARELVDRRQRPVGEHDLAADILALVVLRGGSLPDVDELGRDVGVLAVVGQRDGQVRKGRDQPRRRRDLLECGGGRVPAHVREKVRVLRLAVGGEALDRGVREAGVGGLLFHPLCGGCETGRALHAVIAPELAHGLEGGDTVHLGVDRGGHGVGEERDGAVLGEQGARRRKKKEGEGPRPSPEMPHRVTARR